MNEPSTPRVRRNLDYYLDFAALLTMLGAIATGVILWLVLGHGPGQANKYLWGLHRQEWANLHLALTLTLTGIMIFHLARHWRWITVLTPRHLGLTGGFKGLVLFLTTAALVSLLVWGSFLLLNRNASLEGQGQGWRGGHGADATQQHPGGGGGPGGGGYGRGQGQGQGWRGGRGF